MDDLVQFLRDRFDEDEQRAQQGYYSDTHWERFTTEAHLHAWTAWRQHFPREQWDVKANDAISEAARDGIRSRITAHEADRTQRTLRDIQAKRQLVERFAELVATGKEQGHVLGGDVGEEYLYVVLPVLALPYASHPDYSEAWRP